MHIKFKGGYYIDHKLNEIYTAINISPKYYLSLKKELKIKTVKGYPLIRLGNQQTDGGYVMLNDFQPYGIAYSFGISDNITWDIDMADYNYNVYMYDHTIQKLPYYKTNFRFFREGIAGYDYENQPLKTLDYYLTYNKHKKCKNMILKMDVEGAEWDFLETVSSNTLKQFDQIVFEFHNMIKPNSDEKIPLLKKLNKTHQLIHLHGNNTGFLIEFGNTVFCDVLEATYVNKDKYITEDSDEISLPLDIDYPNDAYRKEIILGKWNEPFVY